MKPPYADRREAGRELARLLEHYRGRDDVLVLGLPRGGVPVAGEIAVAIDAPLDVLLVRKLGAPGHEELAMGAIASGDVRVLNPEVVRSMGVSDEQLDAVTERERGELRRREQAYRGDRPPPDVQGRCCIVVDDGLATGASMRVAVSTLRRRGPALIVVAVPVAPPDTLAALEPEVDEVVCPAAPEPFLGVGRWYREFEQTTDDEVRAILDQAWQAEPG